MRCTSPSRYPLQSWTWEGCLALAIHRDDSGTLYVGGTIDHETAGDFAFALSRPPGGLLTIDLAGLTAMDEDSVRTIALRLGKGPVTLINVSPGVMQLFVEKRLDGLPGFTAVPARAEP